MKESALNHPPTSCNKAAQISILLIFQLAKNQAAAKFTGAKINPGNTIRIMTGHFLIPYAFMIWARYDVKPT